MKRMYYVPLLLALLGACSMNADKSGENQREKAVNPEEWIQLFNGRDLEGWTIKMTGYPLGENFNNTFRVKDGMLITRYDQYESFQGEYGHIFYKNPYSHYRLRVEYRIVGEQVSGGEGWAMKNSGVMFHAQAPESMLLDQEFPVSIEAQFLGGLGDGERPTGNLCTPGTNVVMDGELITQHCINSSSPTFQGEEWVTFELVVHGDSIIHHLVNGDTVLSYEKPQVGGGSIPEGYPYPEATNLPSGYIALQAESHPFDFKKIELLDLSIGME